MSDDDERLKNLLMFKVYATDEEVSEMAPVAIVMILLVAIAMFIYHAFLLWKQG